MKLVNHRWLLSTAIIVGLVISLLPSTPVVSSPIVQLQTTPALVEVVPNKEPVKFTLQIMDAEGQLLENANWQLRLLNPPKTPRLTSDFPLVEGTALLELNGVAPSGQLEFEQVLPIRGTYQLEVKATPSVTGAFEPFEQMLKFSVPENPVKYRNGAILAVILLGAGFGSGLVMGGKQIVRPGEMAPQRVRLLLSWVILGAIAVLLVVNIRAELVSFHTHINDSHSLLPAVREYQGLKVSLSGESEATVGKLASQTVQVKETVIGQPVTDATLKLRAIALENNRQIFAYQTVPDEQGQFTWQEQFFDGALHQILVEVSPQPGAVKQFQPLQVTRQIDVTGIAPPLAVRFITLAYFTAIFILGLLGGLLVRRRFSSQAYRNV